jgi:PAS domain S-box-containing protein
MSEPKLSCPSVLEALAAGVVAADRAGTLVLMNRQAEQITGIERTLALGREVDVILPVFAKLMKKCRQSRQEQPAQLIGDSDLKLWAQSTPVFSNAKVQGCVCHFIPIDQLEQAASKLSSHQQLNRQLHTIFDSSSDGIWVCDGSGKVLDINHASERLNGIRAEEVMGSNMASIVADGVIDNSVTREVLETRRQVTMMQYVPKTDKHLLVTGTPAFDEQGNLFLVVVNERDMTSLNAIRQELQEKQLVTDRYREELTEISLMELERQEIVAESRAMQQVLRIAFKLARLDASNILILGESGTGKGLLARFIHRSGKGTKKPFIQINCAALPENLLEAELFGYETGAFTGARQQGKVGLFELAHEGTLFLDEIGDLPFSVQAKLLKYLDDQEIMRLGSVHPRRISCTIIAATNCDLEQLTRQRKFRQDLYFRLNAFKIKIPPLRERLEDLFQLIKTFVDKYNKSYGLQVKLSPAAFALLQSYPFPGNVRELENVLKEAMVMSAPDQLEDFLRSSLSGWKAERCTAGADRSAGAPFQLAAELLQFEKQLLEDALEHCRTTRELARFIGTSQSTAVRKLRQHGLRSRQIQK